MDIFVVLESCELSEKHKMVGDLHYREGLTSREEVCDRIEISERDRYRKKKEVSQYIVKVWHESGESIG